MAEVVQLQAGTLADRINAEHQACLEAAHSTLTHAIEAGRLLAQVKADLPHGTWLPWLEANFAGSVRNAQGYMRLYDRREEVVDMRNGVAYLSLRDALKALTAPREPQGPPPVPGTVPLTPEQEKRRRAEAAKEQRLLRKAEFALRTGNLDLPGDLTVEEGKKWRGALFEAAALREKNLPNVLDMAGHVIGTLAKHADPERVAPYLDHRADLIAELQAGVVWLQRVLAEAEEVEG